MAAQMNIGGAIGGLMSGNPIAALHALFDESPRENIREAAYDMRTGKCTPEQALEKIMGELQKGGNDESLPQVAQLVAQLQAGGDPDAIFQAIHEAVDPKGADKLTDKIGSASAVSPGNGGAFIDF